MQCLQAHRNDFWFGKAGGKATSMGSTPSRFASIIQGGCLYRTTNDNFSANRFTGYQFDFPLICLRRLALPPANARVCL